MSVGTVGRASTAGTGPAGLIGTVGTVEQTAETRRAAPVVVRTRAELAVALADLSGPRRFVATMGALHAGHAALLAAAGPGAVLSIFLNPLQFGPGEDLERYPRTFDMDLEIAAAQQVAVVYAPAVEEMYPGGLPEVRVHAGPLGEVFEGAARPGHFDGVLSVVAKFFGQVRPDIAYFGQKDAQQLALVRRMVRDLDMPVRIFEVPTVRESDGVALSSRNRYLDPDQRQAARAISRALGTGTVDGAREVFAGEPRLALEYCELVDPETFAPANGPMGRLIVAAYAGATRLIDNDVFDGDTVGRADSVELRNDLDPAGGTAARRLTERTSLSEPSQER